MTKLDTHLELPVVAPQFVIDLLQGALVKGVDIHQLVDDIVDVDDLNHPDKATYITLSQYAEIIQRLTFLLEDEFIGLLNHPIPRRTFASWCYAVNGCKNIKEAIDYSNMFLSLFSEQISWSYKELHDDKVAFVLDFQETKGVCNRFMIMSLLFIPIRVLGWFINEKILLERVSLSFEELPCDRPNLGHLLGAELEFGAAENALVFDKRYMSEQIVSTYEQIHYFLQDTRSQLLLRQIFAPFSYKLRSELKTHYATQGDWLSLSEICEHLNLDTSVIQQKLKKEGSSFRALLNEEKERVAKQLLSSTDLSLTDIALEMGYTELSGFHKAFVSWTGMSPGDYRR